LPTPRLPYISVLSI